MARISLIIPVHNGGRCFRRCLAALRRSTRKPDEIIVVADGCSDDSAAAARTFGAIVVETPVAGGPAAARNLGAAMATADVLLFIDADVACHRDSIARFEAFLSQHPTFSAVIGNYDDAPPAKGLLSRYKNLLQHFVHLEAPEETFTFWGACGAIRRTAFKELGGFDESFRRPSIEDIELGYRLRAAGHRIAHRREILVTHMKHWTARSLFVSDVFRRAVPWTVLIAERGVFDDALNIGLGERFKVAAAWLALALVPFSFWSHWAAFMAVILVLALLLANARFLRFLYRRQGWQVAVAGGAWHLFYHWYCGLGYVLGHLMTIKRRIGGTSSRSISSPQGKTLIDERS